MPSDRLVSFHVSGLRSLADVRLDLNGLSVLIGENGAGKSSLVEAFELLIKTTRPGSYVSDVVSAAHGGLRNLLRQGARELRFKVRIEAAREEWDDWPPLEYSVALAFEGNATIIAEEKLDLFEVADLSKPFNVILRDRSSCRVFNVKEKKQASLDLHSGALALTAFGAIPQPAVDRVLRVLGDGRVYVSFDVRPLWVSQEQGGQRTSSRDLSPVDRVTRLSRQAENLANCYLTLSQRRPQAVWERVMEEAKAGLGSDLTAIRTPPVERGLIELQLLFSSLPQPVPASALSDGQLSYLALIALAELAEEGGFVVLDEPEGHLHPELLVRAVWLLERLAARCPVIIATQSDRLLDSLSDPARSVYLCELDRDRATRLVKPDAGLLAKWLDKYGGLGALRAEGYARGVFRDPVDPQGSSR